MDLLWPLAVIHGPSAKEVLTAVGIEATTFRNGMDPEIDMLTEPAFVIAAPAIIIGVIFIARVRGSNQNSTNAITIARRIATKNSNGAITIVRHTDGIDRNFGTGVIGRSTGIITPGATTGGRIIR